MLDFKYHCHPVHTCSFFVGLTVGDCLPLDPKSPQHKRSSLDGPECIPLALHGGDVCTHRPMPLVSSGNVAVGFEKDMMLN
jgi:hypothetical protein